MSHEIRTPMNGILGMIELALVSDDSASQKEYLCLASESASHLLHIINEILDFSKIEAKALDLEWVQSCPAQIVRGTARSLEHLAQAKGLVLDVEIDPALKAPAWMDPIRVRQVLSNLIGNAIKFTTVGRVSVTACVLTAADGQRCMQVSIQDTGIGFDPARKEALFSPFTQADGSVTRSFGGTGLGLAITRSLLQMMGGEISAHGEPGRGANFVVRLPLQAVAEAVLIEQPGMLGTAENRTQNVHAGRSLSILLVEDHAINRKLFEIILRRMGHAFVVVENGQQALDLLAQRKFDLVLMDVMMPVLDGLTALRLLRASEADTGHRTAVLMVTAHAMPGDHERFLAAGADGYVSKPISQHALEQEIARVVPIDAPTVL